MAESMAYDNLIGSLPIRTLNLTLKSGENVVRGQVVAYETTTGKIRAFNSTGSNGVQTIYGIAAYDTDATDGDTFIAVYVYGEFNINELTFSYSGDSATQANINSARALGMLWREFTPA